MPSCEACRDAAGGDAELYQRLLKQRNCTPEEQAGKGAEECPDCGMKAVHIYCNICMNPDCEYVGPTPSDQEDG